LIDLWNSSGLQRDHDGVGSPLATQFAPRALARNLGVPAGLKPFGFGDAFELVFVLAVPKAVRASRTMRVKGRSSN